MGVFLPTDAVVLSRSHNHRHASQFVSETNIPSFQSQGSTGDTLSGPADVLPCRLPWGYILWSQFKASESSLAGWGWLSDRNIS